MIYKMITFLWQEAAKVNDKLFRKGGEFSKWESNDSLGFSEQLGNKYQPSSDRIIKVFNKLNIKPTDSIIDIGCGKGKAMFLMSKFPFMRIDGYDLSDRMVSIANENFIRIGKGNICKAFYADAANYKDYSKYNYFYAFNPVPENVFHLLLTNIENSIEICPREAFFVYLNPVYDKYFESNGKWERIIEDKGILKWDDVYVYKFVNVD